MTIEKLINELNKFPKDKNVKFMIWDEIESQNFLINFNSILDKDNNINIYFE